MISVDSVLEKFARINSGTTVERGTVRIHRFADHFVIWDLTNAGKRGKKVDKLSVAPTYYVKDQKSLMESLAKMLDGYTSYDRVYGTLRDYAQSYPNDLRFEESQERGVDVMPTGIKKLEIIGDHVKIEADYKSFAVRSLTDKANEPTCIPAGRGGQKSIPVFYRWVKDNERHIKSMTFHDVVTEMSKLGIKFHQYCAMD